MTKLKRGTSRKKRRGRASCSFAEFEAALGPPADQRRLEHVELGRDAAPVVEHGVQGRCDGVGEVGTARLASAKACKKN